MPFRSDGLNDNDIDARFVEWGTCDQQEIQQTIYDCSRNTEHSCVIFYPWAECQGSLLVDPWDAFESEGYQHGPFQPAAKTYRLRNIGETLLEWQAATGDELFTVSRSGGTLDPGEEQFVVASVNPAAAGDITAPGFYASDLTFTNLTNNRGNTTRALRLEVLRTQPQDGNDTNRQDVTLNHLWEWNGDLGRFVRPPNDTITIDPAEPTYLLTHGWDGTLDGAGVGNACRTEKYALSSIACAIREKEPDANLLAWDWAEISNPNKRCDIPDELIDAGAEGALTAVVDLLLTGGVSSLNLVLHGATTAAKTLKDARVSGMAARDEGYKLGMALANEIRTHGSLGSELHFIGKSHGGGVLGFAALVMRNRGFPPDTLTTLDTPRLCTPGFSLPLLGRFSEICIVDSLSNVAPFAQSKQGRTAVFYYPDVLGGGFGQPVTGAFTNIELNPDIVPNFDPLDPFNPQWIDHLWISGMDGGVCEADDGWYPQAVRSSDVRFGIEPPLDSILAVDQYPNGCFYEAAMFQFVEDACPMALLAGAPDVTPTAGLSLIAYDPFQTAASWMGNLVELRIGVDPADAQNKVIVLEEEGDASFFKDIEWPNEAAEITFDYMFAPPLGRESLTVYLGDEIVYYDNADVSLATGGLASSGPIYVGHVADTTARLNFVLRTDEPEGGKLGGAVVIDNLRVYGLRLGDVDFDGNRDVFDVGVLQRCFGLVGDDSNSLPPECSTFDMDGNAEIDVIDWGGDPVEDITGLVDLIDGPGAPPIP